MKRITYEVNGANTVSMERSECLADFKKMLGDLPFYSNQSQCDIFRSSKVVGKQ